LYRCPFYYINKIVCQSTNSLVFSLKKNKQFSFFSFFYFNILPIKKLCSLTKSIIKDLTKVDVLIYFLKPRCFNSVI